MKKLLLGLLSLSLASYSQVKVTPLASGEAYTSLSMDIKGRLWAGTSKKGLWLSYWNSAKWSAGWFYPLFDRR